MAHSSRWVHETVGQRQHGDHERDDMTNTDRVHTESPVVGDIWEARAGDYAELDEAQNRRLFEEGIRLTGTGHEARSRPRLRPWSVLSPGSRRRRRRNGGRLLAGHAATRPSPGSRGTL